MRILIIGGTAFIGYWTLMRLNESNRHTIAIFNRGSRSDEIPSNIKQIHGNRDKINEYKREFTDFKPDVVVDMFPLSDADAKKVTEVFKSIAPRIVALSSCDVYRAYDILIGNRKSPPDQIPLTENSPLREEYYPYRDYSSMPEKMKKYDKILAEKIYLHDDNFGATILRLPMVHGPRDYQHRLYGYIKRMDDNRPAVLIDKRQAYWKVSRGYVEDLAYGISLAVESENRDHKVFNLADKFSFTEQEWVQEIGKSIGWDGKVVIPPVTSPELPEEPMQDLVIDTTKIRKELGYLEPIPFDEALNRTIEWERNNPPEKIDPQSFDYEKEDNVLKGMRIL